MYFFVIQIAQQFWSTLLVNPYAWKQVMVVYANRSYSRFRVDALHRGHVVGRDVTLFAGRHSAHRPGIPPVPCGLVQGFQPVPRVEAQILLRARRVVVQGHIEAHGRGRRNRRLPDWRVLFCGCSCIFQNRVSLLFISLRLFETGQERVPASGKSLSDLHLVKHRCALGEGVGKSFIQVPTCTFNMPFNVALRSRKKKITCTCLGLSLWDTTCPCPCRCTWPSSTPAQEWGVARPRWRRRAPRLLKRSKIKGMIYTGTGTDETSIKAKVELKMSSLS